jgi:hypothetical protein
VSCQQCLFQTIRLRLNRIEQHDVIYDTMLIHPGFERVLAS